MAHLHKNWSREAALLQLFKIFRFHDEDKSKILQMNGYKAENPYFQSAEYTVQAQINICGWTRLARHLSAFLASSEVWVWVQLSGPMKVDEGLVSFSKLPRISIQSIPSPTICDGPPSPTGRGFSVNWFHLSIWSFGWDEVVRFFAFSLREKVAARPDEGVPVSLSFSPYL